MTRLEIEKEKLEESKRHKQLLARGVIINLALLSLATTLIYILLTQINGLTRGVIETLCIVAGFLWGAMAMYLINIVAVSQQIKKQEKAIGELEKQQADRLEKARKKQKGEQEK